MTASISIGLPGGVRAHIWVGLDMDSVARYHAGRMGGQDLDELLLDAALQAIELRELAEAPDWLVEWDHISGRRINAGDD